MEKVEVTIDSNKRDSVEEKAREASEYLEGFKDFFIEGEEDLAVAIDCLRDVKKNYKDLKAEQELATKPMNSALKQVRSWFKPALDVLESTERLLKAKVAAYHEKVAEDSRRAMEAAAEASRAGDFDGAHEASKGIQAVPVSKGITVGARGWDYRVINLDLVPREYLALDHSAVKMYLKVGAGEEPAPIPGLEFFPGSASVTVRQLKS